MKYWNTHFSQFQAFNWLMVWLLMCSSAILLFPAEKLGPAAAEWLHACSLYLWLGILVAGSYFLSQLILILLDLARHHYSNYQQREKLEQMVRCLDFSERAVLREFILQRKSVIKLPVTEPAVKNLLDAGVLTYAYGQPFSEDDIMIKALMIALPARPLITYKALGLSKGKMSEEQIEQIMSARPKFAGKGFGR
ncbi:superinfection exclusion B family protein [Pseudaeromonas pectinilytica]|nr:superinfection exclusion B family protein [Aeromonadaceae bacterium]MBP8772518.1 superinfection exclusion B family protein [Aeromonadaceae bacterium]